MPVLTDPQRQEGWAEFMRAFPPGATTHLTKSQWRSLLNAVDQVLSDQAGPLNGQIQAIDSNWNTLPIPAKSFVFQFMVEHRWRSGV